MLNGNVLVLNRVLQPVQITSVKRAFTLLCKGHVKVVDSDYRTYTFEEWKDVPVQPEDAYVSTPKLKILVPTVIQLLFYDRLPKQEVKFSRGNIYIRDKNKCQYCGKRFTAAQLSLDHVIPVSKGGTSTWENIVCACLTCNVKKGDKLLKDSDMKLIKQPKQPRWHPLHRLIGNNYPLDKWKNFLDEAYWNAELKP